MEGMGGDAHVAGLVGVGAAETRLVFGSVDAASVTAEAALRGEGLEGREYALDTPGLFGIHGRVTFSSFVCAGECVQCSFGSQSEGDFSICFEVGAEFDCEQGCVEGEGEIGFACESALMG